MGQKSNTTTVRANFEQNLSFSNQTNDTRTFQCGFNYLNSIETLFSRKNILITKKQLNFIGNLVNLNFTIFYDNSKLSNYKKRTQKMQSVPIVSKKRNRNCTKVISLFTSRFTPLRTNLALINLKVLNTQVDKPLLKDFYQKVSRFVNVLFQRKFNLFIDFIKITVLFFQKKVQALIFLNLLGKIFRVLPKRKHNRFLFFLKHIFQMFISTFNKNSPLAQNQIKGIKFILSGKLQGKTRGSSSCIQVGAVPIQSIEKNIEFSKLHVYTLYGVFGFKIWIYRN